MHEFVRATIDPEVEAHICVLNSVRERSHVPPLPVSRSVGIAIARFADGKQTGVHIMDDVVSQWQQLRSKNRDFTYFSKRYVAGDPSTA
ncbi:MAG TPA: hypothetical protein VNA69_23855 [Thermoanaerobaculia bacterium]|nr:hypothetical protein [Thermoanaerobaculia bacterium]